MAKKKTTSKSKNEPATNDSFEQAAERLDQIVDELETGKLELDDSLTKYEEGIGLISKCRSLLQQAEQKIEQLTQVDASGTVQTKPFDGSATEMDDSGRSRSEKRSDQSSAGDGSKLF